MTNSCPAIILAGGLGTRLRSVDSERPKPMVPIHGKPFLHWLILHLTEAGFDDFILSTGYKATHIEDYSWKKHFPQVDFSFCREARPLGTGGAVQAIFQTHSDLEDAWVINGDTILAVPLPPRRYPQDAHYVALAKEEVFDAEPNLHVDKKNVRAVGPGGSLFDGGQVYLKRQAVERYKGKIPCGLHEVLAESMSQNRVGYTVTQGTCYDIGTPERLKRFESYLDQVYSFTGSP